MKRAVTGRVCSISGCSPGPQGMVSAVWVLEGDKGKPQSGVNAPGGKGHMATNHSPNPSGTACTQPGCALQAGTPRLPPANLCLGAASCIPVRLGDPRSILPALERSMIHW